MPFNPVFNDDHPVSVFCFFVFFLNKAGHFILMFLKKTTQGNWQALLSRNNDLDCLECILNLEIQSKMVAAEIQKWYILSFFNFPRK